MGQDWAQDAGLHLDELVRPSARLLPDDRRAGLRNNDDDRVTIRAEADTNHYETGTKVTDDELAAIALTRHDFHGDWNYTIAH